MKVLFIGPLKNSWYQGGGVTEYLNDIINKFKGDKKIDFEIMSYKYPSYKQKNIKVHKIPFFNLSKHIKGFSFIFFGILYILLNNKKLPKIISIQLSGLQDVFLIPFLKLTNKKVSVTVHCTRGHKFTKTKITRYLFKSFLNKADNIIVVSKDSKKFLEELGVKKDITVIHNGINLEKYENYYKKYKKNLKVEEKTIFYFGRLSKEKGIFTLLKAAKELEDFKFEIAGKGPLKEDIDKYIKKNEIKNVKLMGYLSEEKLIKEIMNSEIVVLPSNIESFGLAIAEAMALSKPVISTKVGSIPELINHKKTGILISPKDYKELTKKILELHNNPKLRKKLGVNARKEVKKRFCWNVIFKKVKKHYKKIYDEK